MLRFEILTPNGILFLMGKLNKYNFEKNLYRRHYPLNTSSFRNSWLTQMYSSSERRRTGELLHQQRSSFIGADIESNK